MADYTQDMLQDPAKWYERKQSYELSLACHSCIHHGHDENGRRECKLKGLKGIEMSMCGEFRPKKRKRITVNDLFTK